MVKGPRARRAPSRLVSQLFQVESRAASPRSQAGLSPEV